MSFNNQSISRNAAAAPSQNRHRFAVAEAVTSAGLQAPVHFYLSDEWFTPDGATAIAIPFYLAHPRLMRLEESQMLEVEGGEHEWCMRILRHEAGHAVTGHVFMEGHTSTRLTIRPRGWSPTPRMSSSAASPPPATPAATTSSAAANSTKPTPRFSSSGCRHRTGFVYPEAAGNGFTESRRRWLVYPEAEGDGSFTP